MRSLLCVGTFLTFVCAAVGQDGPVDEIPPDEGVWSIWFDVATAGEGVRLEAGDWYYEPYQLRASIHSHDQTVTRDGTIQWTERGKGLLTDREALHTVGGSSHHHAWYLPILSASGDVRDHRLSLEIEWTGADGEWYGTGSDGSASSGTQSMSDDGKTVTVTGSGSSHSLDAHYWTSHWELQSEGVEYHDEDDFIYDVEVFRGTQNNRLSMHPPVEALPVQESIIVSHLRVRNRADLSVQLTQLSGPTAFEAENAAVEITVTNHGPDTSGGFSLSIHFPPYVTVPRDPARDDRHLSIIDEEEGVFEFVFESLAVGQSRSVPITVHVPAGEWPQGSSTGFVAVSAEVDGAAVDPRLDNNRVLEPIEFATDKP